MLEAREITKRYGGHTVLNKVNFTINHGEVVGLVGLNGSGKTTLLDILSGRVCPDAGQIWMDGEKVGSARFFKKRIPIFRSYQVPRLFQRLSVAENLALGRWALSLRNTSKRTESDKTTNYITKDSNNFELKEYLEYDYANNDYNLQEAIKCHQNNSYQDINFTNIDVSAEADTLSIGQRRRVVLDWTQVRKSSMKYFLLDEPAAGADTALVDLLLEFIDSTKSLGCGILLVEHRDNVIRSACDRIFYMADGNCTEEVGQNDIKTKYDTPVRCNYTELSSNLHFTAQNLSIGRGFATVLSNINIEASVGDIIVITGPNGCGKSTLLRAIYGDPTCKILEGSVKVNDYDFTTSRIKERMALGIQLMPQEGILFSSMAVGEFLRTCNEVSLKKNLNIDVFEQIRIDLPMIDKLWDRSCGLLSGGERRLVSLARVLLLQPKIALLDEPLAGLDEKTTKIVINIITKLAQSGTIIIIAEQLALINILPYIKSIILKKVKLK